jgi:hypothetical protein
LSFCCLVACGGAVEPVGTSQGPGPSPTGSPTSGPTPLPAPSGTTTPVPTPPIGPNAGAWNATASGCGNVFVFDGHTTGRKFLVISADKTSLGLSTLGDSATIDLAQGSSAVSLHVDTFQSPPQEAPYCTDIAYPNAETPVIANATSGTLTITISSVGREEFYAVDVTLHGVVVSGPNGSEVIPDTTFRSVGVGWLPG